MSIQVTHIDPEETIRKLKAKVARLEKALAEQPAQQIADSPDDWSDWRVIPPQSQPAPMIRGDIRDGLVDDEPSQRKPLTDEDFSKLCLRVAPRLHRTADAVALLQAIEAAHGIKE